MPQTCTICESKRRADIDGELVRGAALRHIAARYGLSSSSLLRHKQSHLPDKLALAKRNRETLSADSLLREMADLKERLRRGLDQAEVAGNAGAFVAFGREFRQTLESYFGMSERIARNAQGPLSMAQGMTELRHFLGLDRMNREELEQPIKLLDEDSKPSRLGPQPNNGQ